MTYLGCEHCRAGPGNPGRSPGVRIARARSGIGLIAWRVVGNENGDRRRSPSSRVARRGYERATLRILNNPTRGYNPA